MIHTVFVLFREKITLPLPVPPPVGQCLSHVLRVFLFFKASDQTTGTNNTTQYVSPDDYLYIICIRAKTLFGRVYEFSRRLVLLFIFSPFNFVLFFRFLGLNGPSLKYRTLVAIMTADER